MQWSQKDEKDKHVPVFVLSSFCGVRVAQFLIFCVSYCRYVFVLCPLKTEKHEHHKRTKRTNTHLQYDTQNIKKWATRTPQKDERTNTYLQYDTQNIKKWATRTPQKAKGQTSTYNMIRRILKTEQHEHYKRTKGQTRTYNMIRRILKTEQHQHHTKPKRINTYLHLFVLFVLLWSLHGLSFFDLRLLISTCFMFSLVISTNLWWSYVSIISY
jgi:hypothetical protein